LARRAEHTSRDALRLRGAARAFDGALSEVSPAARRTDTARRSRLPPSALDGLRLRKPTPPAQLLEHLRVAGVRERVRESVVVN
jgi:hypothetical protein